MEAGIENVPQEMSPSQIISEKLTPFKDKLSPKVVELMTADRSKEKDYKVEKADNEFNVGIVHITETWDRGARFIRKLDERYQPHDETDPAKPGDLYVNIPLDRDLSQLSRERIDTKFKADGSMSQEILSSQAITDKSTFGSRDKFFQHAGPGIVIENTLIKPSGEVDQQRYWSDDKWIGNDRYRMVVVKETNGVVEYGTMVHGISLGNHPKMNRV